MVELDDVKAANIALTKRPLVAVFVGGTSGIGEYTVRALAALHGAKSLGLQAYIVGRNEKAAAETIAICSRICPSAHFEFIKSGDLALLKDIDTVSTEIAETVRTRSDSNGPAPIDLLYLSSGQTIFGPRVGK